MRSNEKKYRSSFRNIDRRSSLAWMQEWRIVMRIVSAAAFSLLWQLFLCCRRIVPDVQREAYEWLTSREERAYPRAAQGILLTR